jgi:GT2 family glycosyltransferase
MCPEVTRVILTGNIPESLPEMPAAFGGSITRIENARSRGFGANHNTAFSYCDTAHFCVLNPDIRLPANPFPVLLETIEERRAALVGPAVVSSSGHLEDSVRHFPTPVSLLAKVFGGRDGRYVFHVGDPPFRPDWVGGMFMLFRAEDFRRVRGFDERFFLYYEDVDICARLWTARRQVLACPQAQVVHDAQRASHRDLRHLRWHLSSLARYLWKHGGHLPVTSELPA